MMDPINDIVIKTATGLVSEIFQSTFQGLSSWANEKKKRNDFLGIAAKKYSERFYSINNIVRIFGMKKPIPLKILYVKLNVFERISNRMHLNLQYLKDNYDVKDRKRKWNIESKPATEVYNQFEKFIVLGKPGAGKTTLLKYFALINLEKSNFVKVKRLPVFISLKEWSESDLTLLDYIVTQFEICDFPESTSYITKILEKGKLLILLDGFDEVNSSSRLNIAGSIIDFSNKYFENKFIVSCRTASYDHYFTHFVDVEIADFESEQIEEFIRNWFVEEKNVSDRCIVELKENSQLKELASTPLLLTLLCMAYDATYQFPVNKVDLYKEAIDTLLRKWDASRRIERDEIYRHLSLRRKESLLSKIAAETFEKGEFFIREHNALKYVEKFILNIAGIFEMEDDIPEPYFILKSMEAQHGIIIQRANGIYSFSHLTFQEYFTAKYIIDNSHLQTLNRLVDKYLFIDQWNEVFQITTSMLDDADYLIKLMRKKINESTSLQLVNHLGFLFERMESPFFEHRMIFLFAFLDGLDHGDIVVNENYEKDRRLSGIAEIFGFDSDYDEFMPDYFEFQELFEEFIKPELNQERKIIINHCKVFLIEIAKKIKLRLSNLLNAKRETIILKDGFKSLKFYFDIDFFLVEVRKFLYSNKLLIDCITTDCHVSRGLKKITVEGVLSV